MTGQNSTRHHTTQWIKPFRKNDDAYAPREWNWVGLKKGDVTLPSVLKTAGYKTIHVGKAHFGPLGHEGCDPKNLGFDVNIGGWAWGLPKSYYGKDGYGNTPRGKKGKKNKKKLINNVPHLEEYHGSDTFLTEALTLEAKKEIKKAVKSKKPFFLHMSHYALHSPFQSDPRFAKNYADNPNLDKNEKAFATMVEGMDKSLGDLMDCLEEQGVAENTLIFFLGDNGTDSPSGDPHDIACATPLRGKKGTHYEGGMRVPFLAAWSKANSKNTWQKKLPIKAGGIQRQAGRIMDLFPTILNITGARNPSSHTVDGIDLKPLLAGKSDPSRPVQFLMHFPHSHRSSNYTAYRSGDWKLIYHYFPGEKGNHKEPYELFNLKRDPSESNNLANSNPEKLSAMIKAMIKQLNAEDALYCEKDGKEVKPHLP